MLSTFPNVSGLANQIVSYHISVRMYGPAKVAVFLALAVSCGPALLSSTAFARSDAMMALSALDFANGTTTRVNTT